MLAASERVYCLKQVLKRRLKQAIRLKRKSRSEARVSEYRTVRCWDFLIIAVRSLRTNEVTVREVPKRNFGLYFTKIGVDRGDCGAQSFFRPEN